MATKAKHQEVKRSDSAVILARGVRNSSDFINAMSALMSDLAAGSVNPAVGNAICNAGGKLLKSVELSQKFGQARNGRRVLQLTSEAE